LYFFSRRIPDLKFAAMLIQTVNISLEFIYSSSDAYFAEFINCLSHLNILTPISLSIDADMCDSLLSMGDADNVFTRFKSIINANVTSIRTSNSLNEKLLIRLLDSGTPCVFFQSPDNELTNLNTVNFDSLLDYQQILSTFPRNRLGMEIDTRKYGLDAVEVISSKIEQIIVRFREHVIHFVILLSSCSMFTKILIECLQRLLKSSAGVTIDISIVFSEDDIYSVDLVVILIL
jgi:hypothetical protein